MHHRSTNVLCGAKCGVVLSIHLSANVGIKLSNNDYFGIYTMPGLSGMGKPRSHWKDHLSQHLRCARGGFLFIRRGVFQLRCSFQMGLRYLLECVAAKCIFEVPTTAGTGRATTSVHVSSQQQRSRFPQTVCVQIWVSRAKYTFSSMFFISFTYLIVDIGNPWD